MLVDQGGQACKHRLVAGNFIFGFKFSISYFSFQFSVLNSIVPVTLQLDTLACRLNEEMSHLIIRFGDEKIV